jgi:hypothetical protein
LPSSLVFNAGDWVSVVVAWEGEMCDLGDLSFCLKIELRFNDHKQLLYIHHLMRGAWAQEALHAPAARV